MPKLNIAKIIKYWRESAKESWRIANALYEKREYPYALFFGHLTLEKALKALVVKNTKAHAKYTHNLLILAEDAKLQLSDAERRFLIEVTEFTSRRDIRKISKVFIKNIAETLKPLKPILRE